MTSYSNKFGVDIDLQGNTIIDFKAETVTELPSTADNGRIVVYNNLLYLRSNGTWVSVHNIAATDVVVG